MSRSIELSVDEFYHIFNHGNGDRLIFLDNEDKERFVALLYLANGSKSFDFIDIPFGQEFVFDRGDPLVAIGAWCLMDNHYHLLIREIAEGGISRFMHRLATSYTMYFNARHKKRGSLFEGRFRAKHLDSDPYLRYMFAYIHLNPVKMIEPKWKILGLNNRQKVLDFLNEYAFSSYFDYLNNQRQEKKIINPQSFPGYFKSTEDVLEEMFDWLDFEP